MIGFEYRVPENLEELCAALADLGDEARIISGGTALILLMKQRLLHPAVLLSMRRLPLAEIAESGGQVRIGATVTHRQVEQHPVVQARLPVLAETIRRVATPRIRNQGTLGGNLVHADPNQDPPPTLLALDAAVVLRSQQGARTVSLDEFFVDYYETAIQPGEVLTEIVVPVPEAGTGMSYLKFLPRTADDYATVSAAAAVQLASGVCRNVRLALGSVGPTPYRATAAEGILEGRSPTEQNLRAAAASVSELVEPLDDVRGSAEYKRDMAAVFAYRALKLAVDRASAPGT